MNLRTKNEVTNETIMLDRGQAQKIFNLGWQTLDNIAKDCGARISVGRRILYHKGKLEAYFNSLVE